MLPIINMASTIVPITPRGPQVWRLEFYNNRFKKLQKNNSSASDGWGLACSDKGFVASPSLP